MNKNAHELGLFTFFKRRNGGVFVREMSSSRSNFHGSIPRWWADQRAPHFMCCYVEHDFAAKLGSLPLFDFRKCTNISGCNFFLTNKFNDTFLLSWQTPSYPPTAQLLYVTWQKKLQIIDRNFQSLLLNCQYLSLTVWPVCWLVWLGFRAYQPL